MQRHHRELHRLSWLLLFPLLLAAVGLALRFRPQAPVNERLPETLPASTAAP